MIPCPQGMFFMSLTVQDILRNEIDGILVINMDSNAARYEAFKQATRDCLPECKVERVSAVVGRNVPGFAALPWFTERTGTRAKAWAGAAGCALSHRKCIETARSRGWRNVLIMEDDAVPCSPDAAAELLHTALTTLKGGYMLYLGHTRPLPHGTRQAAVGDAELWRVDGVLATHAYIVTAGAYEELLSRMPTEKTVWPWMARYKAVDVYYRDYVAASGRLPVFSVYPNIFLQAGGVSDITGKIVPDDTYSCHRTPYPRNSFCGFFYRLAYPCRYIKVRLNSLRTLLRARWHGFPGYRRRKQ